MCAAKSGTPSLVSAGAATTAQMMYEAVTGTASPTIQTISAVNTVVKSRRAPTNTASVLPTPSSENSPLKPWATPSA